MKLDDINFKTRAGYHLAGAIVKRYTEHVKRYKEKPKLLKMGQSQKEIYDGDEVLREFIKDGEISFEEKQSQLRFK